MKMSIPPLQSITGGRYEMIIEHAGRQLSWDVGSFHKDVFNGKYDPCTHINAYWARLPGVRQEQIFQIYEQIRTIFEDGVNTSQMIDALVPKIKELCDEHPIEELSRFIAFHAPDINIPNTFQDQYVPNEDQPRTREKTYTKPDYQQLVTLALSLRIMVPVWGEFINLTKNETGTNFKEFYAYRLLAQTKYVHSPAMEKLRTYVEHNIKLDRSMASAILVGVGSEDYSEWLMALVLVRRLCVGDISGIEVNSNLVTFIYNFIIYKVSGNTSTSFGEKIHLKEFETGDNGNEQNASRIEGYKIKQESSIGDMAILGFYMENMVQVAQQLKPDIDLKLLEQFTKSASALQTNPLGDGQIALTQWVLSPVISPRGIPHLNKKQAIAAIIVAQTWLWEMGHLQLSCLVSSVGSNNNQAHLSGSDGRARIPKELLEQLAQLYPFAKVSSAKQRTKPVNAGVMSIDAVASMFGQRDWILTAPDAMVTQVNGDAQKRRYACPYDIKFLLAQLVIQLAQTRKKEFDFSTLADRYPALGKI